VEKSQRNNDSQHISMKKGNILVKEIPRHALIHEIEQQQKEQRKLDKAVAKSSSSKSFYSNQHRAMASKISLAKMNQSNLNAS